MRYQYLLLDNDNTIMDFGAAERFALRDVLVENAITPDESTCDCYRRINDALWLALERGETTQKALKVDRFRQFLAAIGRTDVDAEDMSASYAKKLGDHADLLPGAADFLKALHGKMKIALVSNGVSSIQRNRLALCPYTHMFDAIVISEEVGASKPDPTMLHIALKQLGCTDKSAAVMMGDSKSADIPAAVNAGVDSIYFSLKGDVCDAATYTVFSHREAAELLLNG